MTTVDTTKSCLIGQALTKYKGCVSVVRMLAVKVPFLFLVLVRSLLCESTSGRQPNQWHHVSKRAKNETVRLKVKVTMMAVCWVICLNMWLFKKTKWKTYPGPCAARPYGILYTHQEEPSDTSLKCAKSSYLVWMFAILPTELRQSYAPYSTVCAINFGSILATQIPTECGPPFPSCCSLWKRNIELHSGDVAQFSNADHHWIQPSLGNEENIKTCYVEGVLILQKWCSN